MDLVDQLDGDTRLYFACQGIFGSSYAIVYNGSIPILPDISNRTTNGKLPLSLMACARYSLIQSRWESLGGRVSRELRRDNPATFMGDVFLPTIAGGNLQGLSSSAVLYGESLQRKYDYFLHWNNPVEKDHIRLEARQRLMAMFPAHVELDNSALETIYYLSYGFIQNIAPTECPLDHVPLQAPPNLHNGHTLTSTRRQRPCRRNERS